MALVVNDVNPGGSNGPGGPFISSYHSTDAIATVEGANYFDDASEVLDNVNSLGLLVIFDTTNNLIHLRGYTVTSGVVALVDPTIT